VDEGKPSRPRPGVRPPPAPWVAADAALEDRLDAAIDDQPLASIVPPDRSGGCDFRGAYVFAAGRSPSDALCGPTCSGTVAENTIRAGNGPELESKFSLCTRHSDLLWLLGYHGELRDGSLLRAASPHPGSAAKLP
jgi:hypothetical protein